MVLGESDCGFHISDESGDRVNNSGASDFGVDDFNESDVLLPGDFAIGKTKDQLLTETRSQHKRQAKQFNNVQVYTAKTHF